METIESIEIDRIVIFLLCMIFLFLSSFLGRKIINFMGYIFSWILIIGLLVSAVVLFILKEIKDEIKNLFYYFQKEKEIISGKMIQITTEDYAYILPNTLINDLYGGSSLSLSSFYLIEMVNVVIGIRLNNGKVKFVKLDTTKDSFKKMNLELETIISLSGHKMKYQKMFTFDKFLPS